MLPTTEKRAGCPAMDWDDVLRERDALIQARLGGEGTRRGDGGKGNILLQLTLGFLAKSFNVFARSPRAHGPYVVGIRLDLSGIYRGGVSRDDNGAAALPTGEMGSDGNRSLYLRCRALFFVLAERRRPRRV